MKKIIFTIFLAILGLSGYAQDNEGTDGPKNPPTYHSGHKKHKEICSPFYVSVGTGLNANTGLAGVTLDWPVSKHVAIEGGIGESTIWGAKVYGGVKYFLKPCQMGWAFGGGITYCTGNSNFSESMETINNQQSEMVNLQLNPQTNLFLAAYRYWRLGRGKNRFYLELGYTIPITTPGSYVQNFDNGADPIDNVSEQVLKVLSPGGVIGLITAVGFSFGF